MKRAILFPGQGSQYRGMGKKIFSKYAQQTTAALDILGYDLEELCVKDPNKQLRLTQFTQPALYTVKVNFQIHTGPSLGAFNQWVKGTALENWRNRHANEIGIKLMNETAELLQHTLKNMAL